MLIRSLNFLEIKLRQPRIIIALAVAFLLFYLAPLLMYGQNLYFQIFDNLDSVIVWMKVLAESGMIFADSNAIIPNMMGGLPRHTYGSEFNALLWLFYFFPPFTAYLINEILMHSVAFVSMWILLRQYLIPSSRSNIIYVATGSLYFALLPYWPGGGLSIPAMPLVVYALLNIRAGNSRWRDWVILIVIPFYSSFVVVYFFFLLGAGIFWIVDSIRKRDWQWRLIGAIIFMGIIYLGVEYRLIYATFFDHGFVSHRKEFGIIFIKSALEAYQNSYKVFFNGHALAKGNHYSYLLPTIILSLIVSFRTKKFNTQESVIVVLLFVLTLLVGIWQMIFPTRLFLPIFSIALIYIFSQTNFPTKQTAGILLLLITISLWSEFWFYRGWQTINDFVHFLQMFNMSRFAFLEPFLWGILSALAMFLLGQKLRYLTIIIMLFWGSTLYIAIHNGTYLIPNQTKQTYKGYYAVEQFNALREFIDLPQHKYRVASLGIHPAIALYNGFYTIDGYSVNYPLEYKHQFEQIFYKERIKNPFIDHIYHEWGNKCYLFTKNVHYEGKNKPEYFKNIELDTNMMYHMGARYLITPIIIPDNQQYLKYEKTFWAQNAYSEIHLYRILPN